MCAVSGPSSSAARKGVDPFSPAWALNERLTLIHVSEDWLYGPRPTYVLPRPY